MLKPESFKICLARRIIEIHPLFEQTKIFCSDYLCDGKADFSVVVHPEDILYERKKSADDDIRMGRSVHPYSDEYLETLALYRKIVDKMLDYHTFLFHGSAIAVDGQCYLFTAPSGTGKSTHVRLWREYFGSRAVMINDDKPLLSVEEDTIIVHGTPWNGKHHLGNNCSAPLKAICLLQRGAENQIHPICSSEALALLLQQSHRPKDPAKLHLLLESIDILTQHCHFYRLSCNMEASAAVTAYEGMK